MKNKRLVFFTSVAALLTVAILSLTSRAVTPKEADMESVLAAAKAGGYRIIHAEELWERYRKESEDTLLVDTRQDWEYRTGHIRGALNFSMEPTWWARWRKQGALGRFLGPDKNRFVVFY